ncbi:MAG TPA: heme-binding protein [Phycisphaerales bacterium]|nr:heme-binding protein [Phycisphaerales bacterium]
MGRMMNQLALVCSVATVVIGADGCKSSQQAGGPHNAMKRGAATLTDSDVRLILDNAAHAAEAEKSLVRVGADGKPATTRMHIVVMNRSGSVKGRISMPDAWTGSLQIATSKAWTAASFSSDENALTTRSIGALSQPGGPLWQIGNIHHGLFDQSAVEFPGGLPLYKDGVLVGGIGVSGDGVDQDEAVAKAGTLGYEPREEIRIDKVTEGKVPYVK